MLNRLNIRSKILLMLQIAYLGVHSAREALRDSITNQLLTIRSCVANELVLYYSRLRSEVTFRRKYIPAYKQFMALAG
jgi:hypothetical protein